MNEPITGAHLLGFVLGIPVGLIAAYYICTYLERKGWL